MSHGYSINHDGHDPLVEIADYVLCTLFSEAVQAGKWLVDTVPFRAYRVLPFHKFVYLT